MREASKIRFEGGSVKKSFQTDIDLEFRKAKLLCDIGRKHNFRYPGPIRCDEDSGQIVFERIEGGASIRDDYIKFMTAPAVEAKDFGSVFQYAGRLLAIIHRELVLENKCEWKPSQVFVEAAHKAGCSDFGALIETIPHACLHGDYGMENIERIGSGGAVQLVVFDASPNYFTTFHTNTFGPVYVDIGNFLSALHGLISLKYYPLFKWKRVADLERIFLEGYSQASGIDCSLKVARIFSYASASSYLRMKYRKTYLHDLAMWLLFNRLKGLNLRR